MDVEEHNVGGALEDHLDGRLDLIGLTNDVNGTRDLGPDARADQFVVVDQEDARSSGVGHSVRGMTSWTSVPAPTSVLMIASPPS